MSTSGREPTAWPRYSSQLTDLRERLVAEFAERAAGAEDYLLAAYSAGGGQYELIQAAEASAPQLLQRTGNGDRVLIDFAEEAAETVEFLLGDVAMSPDGRQLGYTVDPDGSDRYQLRLRQLQPHEPGGSRHPVLVRADVGANIAWHRSALVFTELDQAMRPAVLARIEPDGQGYRILLCASAPDYLELTQASDGPTVVISRQSHAGGAVLRLRPDDDGPVPVWDELPGDRVQYDTVAGHEWLLHARPGQPDRLLVREPAGDAMTGDGMTGDGVIGDGGAAGWRCRATAEPGNQWDQVVALNAAALLVQRQGGGQRLRSVTAGGAAGPVDVVFAGPDLCEIGTGEIGTDAAGDGLAAISFVPGFHGADGLSMLIRDSWQSPARRYQIPSAGPVRAVEQVRRLSEPRTGQAPMRVRRLLARSADGTEVPLTVLCPLTGPGPWPVVLYGYGAYGVALDPGYSPYRLSLLERGVAFAIAHVRGGGDLGPAWHEAGRQRFKDRAVQDYLACAQLLLSAGIASPDGLVARSRSAGAAVVAAALNRAPGLFRAAVLELPFVDCLRTLSNPDAPLTELEWTEWGDPVHDEQARQLIAAWSPVDNVRPAPYPALLVTAGTADSRVSAGEPLRYAEAVAAASTADRPVLVKQDSAGHLGHSNLDEDWYDEADVLAFVLDQLGRGNRETVDRTSQKPVEVAR